MLFVVGNVSLADDANTSSEKELTKKFEEAQKELLALEKEIIELTEDLLYPPKYRTEVYLSYPTQQFFQMERLHILVDGELVFQEKYNSKNREILKNGSIQPLYKGNVLPGKHEVLAIFWGISKDNKSIKRALSVDVKKSREKSLILQLDIQDSPARYQPEFIIRQIENI